MTYNTSSEDKGNVSRNAQGKNMFQFPCWKTINYLLQLPPQWLQTDTNGTIEHYYSLVVRLLNQMNIKKSRALAQADLLKGIQYFILWGMIPYITINIVFSIALEHCVI